MKPAPRIVKAFPFPCTGPSITHRAARSAVSRALLPIRIRQLDQPDANIPKRHRPMIALQQQGAERLLLAAQARGRRSLQIDVVVNDLAVVHHPYVAPPGSLVALLIDSQRPE